MDFSAHDLEVLGQLQRLTEDDSERDKKPGLTPEKLAMRIHVAASIFAPLAARILAGERVVLTEPPGVAVPPPGEMMALAIALGYLAPDSRESWRPGSKELAIAWSSIPVGERRQALEEALVELATAGVWGPAAALGSPPVPVDQVAVVLAPRATEGDGISNSFVMQEASARGPHIIKIVDALGPSRAVFWRRGEDQSEALRVAFEHPAVILVMHWDWPIPPSQGVPGGPRLGLGLGRRGACVDAEDLLAQVRRCAGASQCQYVELAVCHGWRLAAAWQGRIGSASIFGLPGFRSEALILESIAEMFSPTRAHRVFRNKLSNVFMKPFHVTRQLFHALCAVPRYYAEDDKHEYDDDEYSNIFAFDGRIRSAVQRGDSER